MHGSLLGPAYSDLQLGDWLDSREIPYQAYPETELLRVVARLLDGQNVVGWFQGRMEYGPRALGARSIIADPRSQDMQSQLNLKIKYRESFRPFAPAVMREHVSEWFELDCASPYMLIVADIEKSKRTQVDDVDSNVQGLAKLGLARSQIPAVTHVDHSARVQTVEQQSNARFHDLLKAFRDLTGCPVLVNTSFNVRGEPVVCTPDDAYTCFMRTEMDYLILGNCVLDKRQQPELEDSTAWQDQFTLD